MKTKSIIFIILLCCNYNVNAQNNSRFLPTIDNILDLKWVVKGNEYSSNLLVYNGLVFETYGLEYALEVKTGEKLYFKNKDHQQTIRSLCSDSILLFNSNEGISLINIYSGNIIYKSPISIFRPWLKKPRIYREEVLYSAFNDTTFAALDLINGRVLWKKNTQSDIYNFPILVNEMLYFADDSFLYAIDKITGDEKWKFKLGPFASNPHISDNILYTWVIDEGLVAFDLAERKVIWSFTLPNFKYRNYEIIYEDDTVYVYSSELYALNKIDGSVYWVNEDLQTGESFRLLATKKYLLTYKEFDDLTILVACDKKNGKIKYEGFQGYSLEEHPLSYLEHVKFRFAYSLYNNMLIAIDAKSNIYCFEVIELND